MDERKQKRGRPVGSKTQQAPTVVYAKPPCPRPACGSTDRAVIGIVRIREISGFHEGQQYNRVVWRRVRCKACQQIYILTSYEFLDEKKNGNPIFRPDSDVEDQPEQAVG